MGGNHIFTHSLETRNWLNLTSVGLTYLRYHILTIYYHEVRGATRATANLEDTFLTNWKKVPSVGGGNPSGTELGDWLWDGFQSHTHANQAFLMQMTISPIVWEPWEQFPSWHTIADMNSKLWREQWVQCVGYIFPSGASVPKTPSFLNTAKWWQPSLQTGEAENMEKSKFSKTEIVIIYITWKLKFPRLRQFLIWRNTW